MAKEALAPESMLKIAEKVPSETFARFTIALLRLAALSPKLSNLMQLRASEKRALAREVAEAATQLSELVKSPPAKRSSVETVRA